MARKPVGKAEKNPKGGPKPKKPKGKVGRPSKYNEELGDIICARLANGESLNAICKGEGMPSESTIRAWSLDQGHPISAKYARAREIGYLKIADELLDIADDGSNDWMIREGKNEDPGWAANGEHIQRSRLRVDTRKWLLSKMLPKVFGDRLSAELTGKDGEPLMPESSSPRDIARAIFDILRTAQIEGEPQ